MNPDSYDSYNKFFVNFANDTKLKIILALRENPLSVSEIVKKVGEEQSKISHNLKNLLQCHILNVKKSGKERIYSLNNDTVIPMLKLVENHTKKCCCVRCEKCQK
jgi:ArsR family transcriptional regulator